MLRKQPTGYTAAYPKSLPPKLEPSWLLFGSLSDADRALSELAGVARTLPNPHLLIRPFTRREAVLSSKIEGTQASLSDLLLFEASDEKETRTSDVNEVANYVKALDYGLSNLKKAPLSLRFFRDLHSILIIDPTKTPGEFRRTQNWIGTPGCSLLDASYVPPPAEALLELMGDLEKFLHTETDIPPLLKYGIAHYQFEAIHPFLDGNGRLGRLLITLLLCADPCQEKALLPHPLLYLSAFFERHRDEYYEKLEGVSRRGEWEKWLRFYLLGVAEQSRDAVKRSDHLFAIREKHKEIIRQARGSALVHEIDEHLFATPIVTVSDLAARCNKSFAGAQNAFNKLLDLGILEIMASGSSRSRLYVAWDIVRAVED